MPKREKTPSPGPDESKFVSIYYPFPPHANMEEEKDFIECARWLACFVGQDNLFSLFHKPTSPNVIIAEINPELTDMNMRMILGKHDWSEIFVNADLEDVTHSRIFYSTFKSRREVEKTGWKAADITENIFKGFNPKKAKKIVFPYPETEFCEPPLLTGEVNALGLFRYLPADIFPEAARKPQQAPSVKETPALRARVVPGSAAAAGMTLAGNSGGGKGKGKKGKGAAAAPDPTIRPTAPLARTIDSSAKAKATFRQPTVTAQMYDEDSDDDAANYMAAHPVGRPANWGGEFDDGDESENKKESIEENGEVDPEGPVQFNKKFTGLTIKEKDGPLCPHHNKRCKSGICEWARDQIRIEKQIAQRNTDKTGQWNRAW